MALFPKRPDSAPVWPNVYTDADGRYIYYDRLRKKGYVVEQKRIRRFDLYAYRYILSLCILILTWYFVRPRYICLITGIGALLVLTALFRFMFLPRCAVAEDFVPYPKERLFDQLTGRNTSRQLATKIAVYFSICVLLIINVLEQNYTGILRWLSYIAAGISLAIAALLGYALSVKKKQQ